MDSVRIFEKALVSIMSLTVIWISAIAIRSHYRQSKMVSIYFYLFLFSSALQVGVVLFEFFLSMILLFYLLAFSFGGLVMLQFFLLKEVENYQFPRVRQRVRVANFIALLWSVGLLFAPFAGIRCRDNHPFSMAFNIIIGSYILLFAYFCVLIYFDLFTYHHALPDFDRNKTQKSMKSVYLIQESELSVSESEDRVSLLNISYGRQQTASFKTSSSTHEIQHKFRLMYKLQIRAWLQVTCVQIIAMLATIGLQISLWLGYMGYGREILNCSSQYNWNIDDIRARIFIQSQLLQVYAVSFHVLRMFYFIPKNNGILRA